MKQMIKEELKQFQEDNLNVKGLVGRDEVNKTANRLLLRLSTEQQRLSEFCEKLADTIEKSFEKVKHKTDLLDIQAHKVPTLVHKLEDLTNLFGNFESASSKNAELLMTKITQIEENFQIQG